jgi:hypothetical protein
LMQMSRTPDILADAAYLIFQKPSRTFTGRFLIDDSFLASEGIADSSFTGWIRANRSRWTSSFPMMFPRRQASSLPVKVESPVSLGGRVLFWRRRRRKEFLSLSEIKSEHSDAANHRGLGSRGYLQRLELPSVPAHSCSGIGMSSICCNTWTIGACGACTARQTQRHGQGIPA